MLYIISHKPKVFANTVPLAWNPIKINKTLGAYASTSKAELFPEVMTKLFTDSINSDNLSLKSNPLDGLYKYPRFVQRFIKGELE